MSGTIPIELQGISSLEEIELFSNKLYGKIPATINSLKHLKLLDIEGNMLTGDLFSSISNTIENLTSLRVSFNNFEGSIPSDIYRFRKLEELWAAQIKLSGTLPESFGALENLSTFES